MDKSKIQSVKIPGLLLLSILLSLLVITTFCYLALAIYANEKENEALALWEKAGYPLEANYQKLCSINENECARDIKALAKKLGIASEDENQCAKVSYKEIYDYMIDQLQKERLEHLKPGKDTVDRLNEIGGDLRGLKEAVEKEIPVWGYKKEDMGRDHFGRMAVLGFERLLCAEALYFLSEGRREEAVRNLAIMSKLAESLQEKNNVSDSIMFIYSFKLVVGTVRFLDPPTEELKDWVASKDLVGMAKNAMGYEAAQTRRIVDKPSDIFIDGKSHWFYDSFLYRPFAKLGVASYEEILLDFTQNLEAADPCELAITQLLLKQGDIKAWNVIAEVGIPNLQDVWTRAYRNTLEKDMTLIILTVRSEKARTGIFPESVELPKSICPKTAWKYEKKGDHFTVYFDGVFQTNSKDPRKGIPLPLKWEE